MTLHLSFPPDTEARLRERAAATGKDVEQIVREVVEEKLAAPAPTGHWPAERLGDIQRLEAELLPRADDSNSVVMDADDVRQMRDEVRRRIEQRADR
jgi:plasmid stability protein